MTAQEVTCQPTALKFGSSYEEVYGSNTTEEFSPDGTTYFTPEEETKETSVSKRTEKHDADDKELHERRKQTKIEESDKKIPSFLKMRKTVTQEQLDFKPVEPNWEENPLSYAYLQSLNPSYPNKYLTKRHNASDIRSGYVIGRGAECDICLEVTEISRRHCLIYMETGSNSGGGKGIRIYLEDQSFNGTFVNGNIVGKNKRTLLREGDKIQLFFRKSWSTDDPRLNFYRIRFPPQFNANTCAFNYEFMNEIGRGSFAAVYSAHLREDNSPVAIKVISKNRFANKPKLIHSVAQEMSIMMTLEKHPFLVRIREIFNEQTHLYLVLEFVRDGELYNLIREKEHFSENETRFIFWQLFNAIKYLHQSGIAHRDLKPENVLLTDKENLLIKVSDFGLAKNEDRNASFDSQCGTPNYVAPEILNPAGERAYNKQCDMWSLGVMLYICLSGYPPFSEENGPPSMKTQIKMGKYEFLSPAWDNISTEAKELVSALLTVDPEERLTVAEALEMPWMKLNSRDFEERKKCLDEDTMKILNDLNSREAIALTQSAATQPLSSELSL